MLVRRTLIAGSAAASLMLGGCGPTFCTLVGGVDGFEVRVANAALAEQVASATLTDCHDGACVDHRVEFARYPKEFADRVQLHADLAIDGLKPGRHDIRLVLTGTGGVVLDRSLSVDLEAHRPNGKRCDGNGFVGARMYVDAAGQLLLR